MKQIDLDKEKECLILVTYGGEKRALTRSDVVRMLAVEERFFAADDSATGADRHMDDRKAQKGRSLGSLGKLTSNILAASGKAVSETDQRRLVAALHAFDGNTGGVRTTQLAHRLRELLEKKIDRHTREEIEAFLAKHPELSMVPRKR